MQTKYIIIYIYILNNYCFYITFFKKKTNIFINHFNSFCQKKFAELLAHP